MTKVKEFKFKRILVGLDQSADSMLAFRFAVNRARQNNAQLILCAVMESNKINVFESLEPSFVYGERKDLVKALTKYKNLAQQFGVKNVKIVIGEGAAGEVIVKDIIPHLEPDLLIIGSKAKQGLSRRFGSQASYMAKYSPIPVMIAR